MMLELRKAILLRSEGNLTESNEILKILVKKQSRMMLWSTTNAHGALTF